MNQFTKVLYLVIVAFAVSCSGKQGQNEAHSEPTEEPTMPKVVGEEVSYSTDSTTMKGYISYDENMEGTRPGIIVVHEWWGHNEYTRDRAEMLAELGYTALAVDMYGDGKQAMHPEDAQKFSGAVFANLDEAKARFTQAIETLKNHPSVDAEKISAIGYCFGGSVVLSMANAGYDLDAVAAFHSGVQLPIQPDAETLSAKVLVANGAADPFISAESVEAFKTAMEAAGADYKYIAYDSAVHAFTNPGADELGEQFGLPLAYNEAADEASWQELLALLNEVY